MRINWQRVILDEAHIVRNHKSLTASAIFKLIAHSRWCLTGTPVHNKDLDLFSLLKFLRCSPFDDIVVSIEWMLEEVSKLSRELNHSILTRSCGKNGSTINTQEDKRG